MSVIDNANHNVVPYISGTTKPFSGQRLITITYKTVTDKNSPLCNVKRDSKAVSVPVIPEDVILDNFTVLVPHIRSMLESVQNKITRELLDSGNNIASISSDAISLSSCIDYLNESDESGRLTKESVAKWFDSEIEMNLASQLAAKLGVSDTPSQAESDKIMTIIAAFKKDISALAGGKTSYPPKVAAQLKKAISLAGESDVIASKFMVRLDKMIQNTETIYSDAL